VEVSSSKSDLRLGIKYISIHRSPMWSPQIAVMLFELCKYDKSLLNALFLSALQI
jgi:hypothetical protein